MIALYLQIALCILGAILTLAGFARVVLYPEARSRLLRLVLAPATLMLGYPLMLIIYAQYDTVWPTHREIAMIDAISFLIPIATSIAIFFIPKRSA
jgi:hypothetical protein